MTSLYMRDRNKAAMASGIGRLDWIGIAGSLAAGFGIGAVGMYLLDPAAGKRRRRALGHLAEEAVGQVGQLGGDLVDVAESATGIAGSILHRAGDRAVEALGDSSDIAGKLGDQAIDVARQHALPLAIGSMMITAIGCAAVGAGLMFILDPRSGHRRRALARDKAYSIAHQAKKKLQGKRKHYSNMVHGVYHQASDTIKQATGNKPSNPDMAWTTDPRQITNPM